MGAHWGPVGCTRSASASTAERASGGIWSPHTRQGENKEGYLLRLTLMGPVMLTQNEFPTAPCAFRDMTNVFGTKPTFSEQNWTEYHCQKIVHSLVSVSHKNLGTCSCEGTGRPDLRKRPPMGENASHAPHYARGPNEYEIDHKRRTPTAYAATNMGQQAAVTCQWRHHTPTRGLVGSAVVMLLNASS